MTDRRTFLCEDFEISYEDTKKGWSMPYSHHHTNYEIYILLSGERLVTIGDITYRVKAGMASLFESNISHRSVGDTDYTGICIHFSKVYLEKYFLPAVVSSYLTCFKAPIIFIPEDYRQKLVDWNAASCCKSPTAYLLLAQILTDLAAFRYQYPLENEISVSENKASGLSSVTIPIAPYLVGYSCSMLVIYHAVTEVRNRLGRQLYLYAYGRMCCAEHCSCLRR